MICVFNTLKQKVTDMFVKRNTSNINMLQVGCMQNVNKVLYITGNGNHSMTKLSKRHTGEPTHHSDRTRNLIIQYLLPGGNST